MDDDIYDVITFYLKKEMFELKEGKDVFVKNKDYHSAVGLQDNEIFIRCDFIENLVKKCCKEMIDKQLSDLQRVRDELNN